MDIMMADIEGEKSGKLANKNGHNGRMTPSCWGFTKGEVQCPVSSVQIEGKDNIWKLKVWEDPFLMKELLAAAVYLDCLK